MKNEKNIQYNIFKSEACGHTIEYKMVKEEKKLTDQILAHAKEDKKTGVPLIDASIADAKDESRRALPKELEAIKRKKEELNNKSEDMEKCADNPDCPCQKEKNKLMKKSEKFYIQKIQELRKGAWDTIKGNIAQSPIGQAIGGTDAYRTVDRNIAQSPVGQFAGYKESYPQQETQKPKPLSSISPQTVDTVSNMVNTSPTANMSKIPDINKPGGMSVGAPAAPTAAPAANPAANPAAPAAAAEKPKEFNFTKDTKFGNAFNQAKAGGVQEFTWDGKKYHTYTKDDFAKMNQEGVKDNKYLNNYNKQQTAATPNTAANPAAAPAANPAAAPAAAPAANPAAANPAAANNASEKIVFDPTSNKYFSNPGEYRTNKIRSEGEMPVELNKEDFNKTTSDQKRQPVSKDMARADKVFEQQNAARGRLKQEPLTREQFDEQWNKLPRGEQIRY